MCPFSHVSGQKCSSFSILCFFVIVFLFYYFSFFGGLGAQESVRKKSHSFSFIFPSVFHIKFLCVFYLLILFYRLHTVIIDLFISLFLHYIFYVFRGKKEQFLQHKSEERRRRKGCKWRERLRTK